MEEYANNCKNFHYLMNKIDSLIKESSMNIDNIFLVNKIRNLRELNEKIYIEVQDTENLEKEVNISETYNDDILTWKFRAQK